MSVVPRGSIARQAAEAIETLIRRERLVPGDALPSQRALCERLGVSRTALREALSWLTAIGRIDVQPGRGVYVASLAEDVATDPKAWPSDEVSPADVYQLRYAIEPFAAAVVATSIRPPALARLTDNVEAMRVALGGACFDQAAELDFEFHSLILRASDNPALLEVVTRRVASYRRSQSLPFSKPEEAMETWREHRRILMALKRHSSRAAMRAMRDHILKAALRSDNAFPLPAS